MQYNVLDLVLLSLFLIFQVWFRRPVRLEGSFEARGAWSSWGFFFLQNGLSVTVWRKMMPGIEGKCYDHVDLSHAGTGPLLHLLGSLQHELQFHVGKRGLSSVIHSKRQKSPHQ